MQTAKLRKKLVKAKRFWKINANRFLETLAKARIRPEIKARRGEEQGSLIWDKKQIGEIIYNDFI